ncbi:MAG: acid phosphatase [Massilia sp.]|nr:acid phosphatase [Massilia sp.]
MQHNKHTDQILLSTRSLRRIYAGLAISALVILCLGRYTDIDLVLADAAFDLNANVFPWRHAWLTEKFNHVIIKWIFLLIGLGFTGLVAVDTIHPLKSLNAVNRLRTRIVALSALFVPIVISSLKQVSSSHCPWDLLRYGGTQPYIRILDTLPFGAVAGHCLPAGHASSVLWILSLTVYWLPEYSRAARAAASMAIAFGGTVGLLQQLRGAHFLTHTLWSIWISCAIIILLITLLQTRVNLNNAGEAKNKPACTAT